MVIAKSPTNTKPSQPKNAGTIAKTVLRGMVFGIDGTGPFFTAAYEKEMKGSFVQQIDNHATCPVHKYWRGPDDFYIRGESVKTVAEYILSKIKELKEAKPLIFLTGYSRGAAMMVDVAERLQQQQIPVEAMFLFDSVNKYAIGLSGETIPANVRYCYQALRDPQSGSRIWMGNSVKHYRKGVKYEQHRFLTTHGGVGGVPWGKAALISPDYYEPPDEFGHPPTEKGRAAELVRQNPTLADKIYETRSPPPTFDGSFTNITPTQEAKGMEQVWSYMMQKLIAHGVIGTKTKYDDGVTMG